MDLKGEDCIRFGLIQSLLRFKESGTYDIFDGLNLEGDKTGFGLIKLGDWDRLDLWDWHLWPGEVLISNLLMSRSPAWELYLLGDFCFESFSWVDSILSSVIFSLGCNRRFRITGTILKNPSRQSIADIDSFSK